MVKYNLEKATYFFNPSVFSNENITDKKRASEILYILYQLKNISVNGKYFCNNTDIENKFYIVFNCDDINFYVPFKAMFFKDNASKLKGIFSFSMSTSTHCNGLKYKTCKAVTDGKNYCYGCYFEDVRKRTDIINSIESNYISAVIFRHVDQLKLSHYIQYKKMAYVRANNHGSFIDSYSVMDFYLMTSFNPRTLFYIYVEFFGFGYKLKEMTEAGYIASYKNNLIINGSNFMIDNEFKITTSLKEYYEASYKKDTARCLSDCINCMNCLVTKNITNVNLLHGLLNQIDNAFYTDENINWIESIFNNEYKIDEFSGKQFFTRIKKMLNQIRHDFYLDCNVPSADTVKNYKDLVWYLEQYFM